MADTGSTDDDQGSSSNPTTPNPLLPEDIPRRRRGRGRGGRGRELVSPRLSRRDSGAGSSSASASAAGVSGQYGGFLEAPVEDLPILDSGNVAAAAGLVIGRSPAAGKRVREATGGSSGGDHGSPVNCTVCGKELKSPKALYGHMRAVHPGRQYVPPPTAEEERILSRNPPILDAAAGGGGGGGDVEEGQISEGGGGAAAPMELEEPPTRLPDLNYPPPPEEDT